MLNSPPPTQELLCEGGLVDDPLLHIFTHHGIAAALAPAVDDFVVGEHGAQFFAPVHGHIDILGVTVQIELFEDPLGPLVELRIAGGDHLVPVIVKTKLLQLVAEGLDVFLREAFRMMSGGDRILFRRQAEAVVSHGMEDVIALHPLHAAYDVRGGISFRMAGMQAYAAGIGKHIQRVEFGLAEIPYVCPEGLVLFPVFLPFRFNGFRVINAVHVSSPDPSQRYKEV